MKILSGYFFARQPLQLYFQSQRDPCWRLGTYSISLVEDSITFNEMNYRTGNFDWNLILTGKYGYSFDGTHLKIWANKNGVGYYEYDLIKN